MFRERMQLVARAKPVLSGAAGIGGQNQLDRHAVAGTQHPEQAVDRSGYRILAGFLDPCVGDVAALVLVGVVDALKVLEPDLAAVRHDPALVLDVASTEWGVD